MSRFLFSRRLSLLSHAYLDGFSYIFLAVLLSLSSHGFKRKKRQREEERETNWKIMYSQI